MPAALAILALSACASHEYMGISLKPGVAAPGLRDLAQRASGGNRQAQLELGIRYEEGQGLPVDLERARKLYTMAASDSGGTMWIYSPSPGGGSPARVLPVDRPVVHGLDEAKRRLRGMIHEAR
ncbi:SEL1-like repeat protein [Sphingobium sp. LMC3-1-1.1]|uniref:SEL1-like repeat protein n=2 Tax=unclassified Sphingobium TaxID=2611147 RepID=UPI0034403247